MKKKPWVKLNIRKKDLRVYQQQIGSYFGFSCLLELELS